MQIDYEALDYLLPPDSEVTAAVNRETWQTYMFTKKEDGVQAAVFAKDAPLGKLVLALWKQAKLGGFCTTFTVENGETIAHMERADL